MKEKKKLWMISLVEMLATIYHNHYFSFRSISMSYGEEYRAEVRIPGP